MKTKFFKSAHFAVGLLALVVICIVVVALFSSESREKLAQEANDEACTYYRTLYGSMSPSLLVEYRQLEHDTMMAVKWAPIQQRDSLKKKLPAQRKRLQEIVDVTEQNNPICMKQKDRWQKAQAKYNAYDDDGWN